MNIESSIVFTDEKPAVSQIRNTEKINVIAIGLQKGQILKKHITPIPALLIVLKGKIVFDMDGEKTELNALETIDIPINVMHEVTALEQSIFTVIKEKN